MNSIFQKPPWRIAIVWLYDMVAQHCLTGLYHQADRTPDVWIRKFDAAAPDFRRQVLAPLRQWQPHGLIVRLDSEKRLRQLRKQFPALPFVSTVMAPPELVNTVVAGDINDSIRVARDYFRKCGLSKVALFVTGEDSDMVKVIAAFEQAVPGGAKLICPRPAFLQQTPPEKQRLKRIMTDGLRILPKPAGMFMVQTEAAGLLLEWCQKLRLRVPQDLQIIGIDEEDTCLGYQPHLSSLVLPNERIGAVALETILHYLKNEQPPPPPLIRVRGGTVVPRGTTALLKASRPAVAGALDLIEAHAAQGVTATSLIKQSKVGRSAFYREFAATTGNTPGRHLRQLRLQNACKMLRETDESVTAIAKACGFNSLIYFMQFFRRETGQTPTTYRKQGTRGQVKDRVRSSQAHSCL